MNKFPKTGGRKILFALMFILLAFIAQARAQVIDKILNRIETNRKALTALQSDLTLGRYNAGLNEWDYSKGKIILVPPGKKVKDGLLRIDWKDPRDETILVMKGRYYVYIPREKVVHTGVADAKKARERGSSIFLFLSMSKAQWKADYKPAQYAGEEKLEGGVPAWHLKYEPKTASEYKGVEIWVDGNGMIVQVKIVPKSGDESFVRLINYTRNPTFKPSQFQLDLPPGVKELKN